MIRMRENDYQKSMNVILKMQVLTSEEIHAVETYFETGEDALLEKLMMRSLEGTPSELMQEEEKIMDHALSKKRYEEVAKLAKVWFAIGGSSSYELFPEWSFQYSYQQGLLDIPAVIYACVKAECIGQSTYNNIKTYVLNGFKEGLKDNALPVLKEAYPYMNRKNDRGRLCVLMMYFWCKYDTTEFIEPKQEGKRFFERKIVWDADKIDKEDAAMLQQYEEIVIQGVRDVLSGVSQTCYQNVQDKMRDRNVPDFSKEVHGVTYDALLMSLLGGASFVNVGVSTVFRNFVACCFALDAKKMIEIAEEGDVRADLSARGGTFDELFGLKTSFLLTWAAVKQNKNILAYQFWNHRDTFMKFYENGANARQSAIMGEVIKREDKKLYEQLISNPEKQEKDKNRFLLTYLENCPVQHKNLVIQYLNGEKSLEELYPIEDELKVSYGYTAHKEAIEQYRSVYGDEEFCLRAYAYAALCRNVTVLSEDGYVYGSYKLEKVLSSLQKAGMDYKRQLSVVSTIYQNMYSDLKKETCLEEAIKIFAEYYKEAEKDSLLSAFMEGDSIVRFIGLCVLIQFKEENRQEILNFAKDTAKTVRIKLEEFLKEQKDWHKDIVKLIASKKQAEREVAYQVLISWNEQEYKRVLEEAYEKEKSTKLKTMLASYLNVEADEENGAQALSLQDTVKSMVNGTVKRSLSWAYEKPFSPIHNKDGKVVDEMYMQALLASYSSLKTGGISEMAKRLAEELKEDELAVYMGELFQKWLEDGAQSKRRWVLYAAAIHGGSDIIKVIYQKIQEWPQHARGAIAAEAVKALALNPSAEALLIVDGIARKFKFKQVKKAAGEALDYAAQQLGITRDQLEDKIVPNLGFDSNMERIFDYGSRKFKVTLTPELEIEVFKEDGKKVKNLPAPGKNDVPEIAAKSYAEFKEMKKQMKMAVKSQKTRLELALSVERLWSGSEWKELFVKNPIMHQFAIGLIWGVYEEHKLLQSFRYMEDGSFNTEEEEEYTLPEDAEIGLVHPIELTKESLDAWREQLSDYEITQPFLQLDRPIYRVKEEEKGKINCSRFEDIAMFDLSLTSKLQALGWLRGDVLDAGGFDAYYRIDATVGLGATLFFSGSYVGSEGMDVTIGDICFFPQDNVLTCDWGYRKKEENHALCLEEVPERYFSEMLLQIANVTANAVSEE